MDQNQFDFNNSKGMKSLFKVALDTLNDTEGLFANDHDVDQAVELDVEHIIEIDGLTLTRQIGKGSMGEVWLATQHRPHRLVAVKFIRSNILQSARVKYRFLREIELTGKLDHPGVCQIYDSGVSDGHVYYFMKYVDGDNLGDYLSNNKLSAKDAIQLTIGICHAVHHAHQQGIIHRDLKPSNIVVDQECKPHVLDFGIASTFQSDNSEDLVTLTFDEEIIGTVKYMSPEQARGHHTKINTESDIYSIGVILYQMLTGRYPFIDGTDFEIREQISKGIIQRPRAITPEISRDLEAVVLKAMQLDPVDRYHSAAEFADDLENVLSGNPVTARKVTVSYVLQKNVKKYPIQSTILISAILIIISLLSWNYFSVKHQRDVNAELAELNAQGNHDRTISMVSKDIQLGQIRSASAELDTIPERLRNIEYRILNHVLDNRVWSVEVPRANYDQLSYNPDSSVLTLTSVFGSQQLVDLTDFSKAPVAIQGATEKYRYYANDGHYGINRVKDEDGFTTYQVFNTKSGILQFIIPDPDNIQPTRFHISDDRKYIVYSNNTSLGFIDTESTAIIPLIESEHAKYYRSKVLGHHMLVGVSADLSRSELVIYDIEKDQNLLRQELPRQGRGLAVHPQLSLIATSDKDGRITIWEYENGKLEKLASFPKSSADVSSVRFSVRDPCVIVTYRDGKTSRMNYLDDTVHSYYGIFNIACSAIDFENSNYFITAGMDEIACYKLNQYSSYGTPTEHRLLQYSQNSVQMYAQGKDGPYRMYAVTSDRLNEYDFATNQMSYKLIPDIKSRVVVNERGQLYYTIYKKGETTLYAIDSHQFMNSDPVKVDVFGFGVNQLRCIPESDLLLIVDYDQQAHVYDTNIKKIIHSMSNIDLATPSRNGKYLYTSIRSEKKQKLTNIRRYDTSSWTYENIATVNHIVKYLHISNHDQWLVAADTVFDLSILDIQKDKLVIERKLDSNKSLGSIIFSDDDRRMIIGGKELTIFNTATWRPTLVIPRTGQQRYVPMILPSHNKMLYVLKSGRLTTYP